MDTLFFKSKQGANPFEDETLPSAHYHPSLQKHLTDTETKINLSPKRLPEQNASGSPSLHREVKAIGKPSPAEKDFLKKANTILAKELPTHDTPSPGNASSKFDESWPTSERPSTIESPGEYRPPTDGNSMHIGPPGSSSSTTGTDYLAQWRNRYSKQERRPDQHLPAQKSTLAKYIQRFRYSEPKSRQERDQEKNVNKGSDFWWLAPPSRTSTPTDDDSRISAGYPTHGAVSRGRERGGISGRRESAGSYGRSTSSVSPSERVDTDTDDLQTRAERLLERSESTILTDPAISSEGIGVSSTSSNYQEPAYLIGDMPRLTAHTESFNMPPPMGAGHQPVRTARLHPEDDILHQWRVRRRLEEARRQTIRRGPLADVCRATKLENPHHGGSRLEDFRKRLKQQQLLSQAVSGTLQNASPEPVTKTIGTSPMPQTMATQTNGVLPSVGDDVPVRDRRPVEDVPRVHGKVSDKNALREALMSSRSHIHDVSDIYGRPARGVVYQKYKEHGLTHNPQEFASEPEIYEYEDEPIIASPSIRQTAGQKNPVLPHLHMACDIIPCPQDRRMDRGSHLDASSQGSRFVTDERSGPVGEHKTADQGERLSVTRQPTSQHPVYSRQAPSSKDYSFINREHLEEKADHPEITQRGDTQEGELRQRLDFEKEEAGSNGRRQGIQNVMMPSVVCGDVPLREDAVDEEEREDGKDAERGTPPRRVEINGRVRTSSPIGDAVGQVITDRLFTTPKNQISSPQSSIDSLPSMHSSLKSHRSETSIAPRTQHVQGHLGDEVTLSSSDGEEFAEDELLQLLRQRRAQYENQLQTLDGLIETQMAGM